MKTKDNEIKPFTAMYQNIDEQRGISAFTLQNVAPQIEGKKNVSTKCYIVQFKHKKMNESVFQRIT